jgi:hypothetical protein
MKQVPFRHLIENKNAKESLADAYSLLLLQAFITINTLCGNTDGTTPVNAEYYVFCPTGRSRCQKISIGYILNYYCHNNPK